MTAVEHRFGPYGGQYVPETLMPALAELEAAWVQARDSPDFRAELDGLLHDHPDLTSLVVHNEPLVEPAIRAVRRAGRAVPDEVSVVAICPDEVAERSPLPVTSVRIPSDELGHRAVELLMTLLDGGTVPETTLLTPELTIRASTAPPPGL